MRSIRAFDIREGLGCYVDAESAEWYVADRPADESRRVAACQATQDDPADRTLTELWLYLTSRCNQACRHCLLPEHASSMPQAALLRYAEEAVSLGSKTVYLTGGEPLLHPGFVELVAALAPQLTVAVLTNGTLIDDAFIERLEAAGLGEHRESVAFQVSIEGPGHVHDGVRGEGSYDAALRGIRTLAAWGRPPAITTALNAATTGTVTHVTELAAELGCRVHHLFLPHRSGRLACEEELLSEPAELLAAIRSAASVARECGVILSNDAVIAGRVRKPGCRFEWCEGGRGILAVGPDGRVYPCPSLTGEESVAGPPAGEGIAAALDAPAVRAFRETSVTARPSCAGCELRFICGGGCAAHALRHGGGILAEEPYCEVYRGLIHDRLRAEAETLLHTIGFDGTPLRPHGAGRRGETYRFGCT